MTEPRRDLTPLERALIAQLSGRAKPPKGVVEEEEKYNFEHLLPIQDGPNVVVSVGPDASRSFPPETASARIYPLGRSAAGQLVESASGRKVGHKHIHHWGIRIAAGVLIAITAGAAGWLARGSLLDQDVAKSSQPGNSSNQLENNSSARPAEGKGAIIFMSDGAGANSALEHLGAMEKNGFLLEQIADHYSSILGLKPVVDGLLAGLEGLEGKDTDPPAEKDRRKEDKRKRFITGLRTFLTSVEKSQSPAKQP
jgi:hypothetical protein